MCQFFSFLTDGDRRIYYFSGEQRRKGLRFRDGQKIDNYDSHTSIARYYGLHEDDWSRAEYNPFTDALTLDQQCTTWDEGKVRGMLDGVDWRSLCGDLEGARAFLKELKTIPFFRADGTLRGNERLKLFETRDDARFSSNWAARNTARNAARRAAGAKAWKLAWMPAGIAAQKAALAAPGVVPLFTAYMASWDAARDTALYMTLRYVCADLPIAQEHIDYVTRRMDVWRHGYGVICDVDGVLYCYERL